MRASRMLVLATLAPVASACGGSEGSGGPDARIDPAQCGDVRVASRVFFGSEAPSYAPLTAGQIQAIGAWTKPGSRAVVCSGTLITPTHVLTADHCTLEVGDAFCIGDVTSQAICIASTAVHTRPTVEIAGAEVALDLTLVELEADATEVVPGTTPIPIATDPLGQLAGHRAETAGFGQTEANTSGRRLFALERVDAVGASSDGSAFLRVDGDGARGVCFGDSGGPALILDDGGAVRVAGALSYGDDSCVDKDRYTRVDVARSWIEGFTGATPAAPPAGCGPIDGVGLCSADRALWCENGMLSHRICPVDCGWDATASGFRCLDGADPCQGQDLVGSCQDGVARWCDRGQARQTDCGCLGQACVIDPSIGASCREDPCGGLDRLGRCNGNVAEWCENGRLARRDCSPFGQTCQYVNDEIGYYCE